MTNVECRGRDFSHIGQATSSPYISPKSNSLSSDSSAINNSESNISQVTELTSDMQACRVVNNINLREVDLKNNYDSPMVELMSDMRQGSVINNVGTYLTKCTPLIVANDVDIDKNYDSEVIQSSHAQHEHASSDLAGTLQGNKTHEYDDIIYFGQCV